MAVFLSLSSGSNGNCYYLGDGKSGILIDLGIGTRSIKKRLASYGIDINSISAVLVSHDHFDHIRSLGTFTERFHKPVYTTAEIIKALETHYCTKGYMSGCCNALVPGRANEILLCGSNCRQIVTVTPFRVPHDAADTVGFHIGYSGKGITFITDIGEVTDEAVRYASMSDCLIIEANYDVDMLMRGPYPPELKARIMQGHGHLSNEQTASLLRRATRSDRCPLKQIFLCHLSENNNTPSVALGTIKKAIPGGIALYCLPRRDPSEAFEV